MAAAVPRISLKTLADWSPLKVVTKLRLVGLTKKEATESEEATRGLWLKTEARRDTATGKQGSYQHCMTREDV